MAAASIVVGWQLVSTIFEPLLLPRYALVVAAVNNLSLLLIPVSIALAVLRYRLWDIDFLINRALLYGILTVLVVSIYLLLVGLSSALLPTEDDLAGSLLAAGVVALLFAPLRDRLQRGVNRLMYGERDDPYRVLSGLGKRLETALAPNAILPTITETVAGALKVPYAAITLKEDGQGFVKAASYGKKDETVEPLSVPLTYQKEVVGELLLAPRAPGEVFGRSDLRLLEDLSRQIGVAAHAVRLTADLQRSRERLVTAREEERRRLRRDLHDGVGPQLAALMLELETARELASDNPEASALMAKLAERARETVADVRRSVHALRPPALDELGLIGALREVAGQYSRGDLRVSVKAPDELPPLSAAVEVACYRIAQEAMTNVVRHAGARHCWVRIALDEEADMLDLEVEDDGRGISENDKAGVGMSSMRERAEELGGNCAVVPSARGGTLVSALLPCRTADGTNRKEG
jgi:signal transduction histidine kinase